ncbi:MAG: ABC transporter substrate-binding protein [Armatimonadetes bacterium]|nr:ABC transporter substrate-binding protein [Armatimonadota bacterium]
MRQGVIRILGIGLAAVLLVAGWIPAVTPTAAAPAGVQKGGVVSISLLGDPIMNPITGTDISSVLVNKVLFSALVRPSPSGLRPSPDLAESWTVSADGRRWTFNLRRDVKWHDGVPFTSADVRYTFDQILDAKIQSRQRSDFAALDRVETPDPYTAVFVLRQPFAPLPVLLGHTAGIGPKHILEKEANVNNAHEFNKRRPVGTGPFMIREARAGSHYILVRNPNFYREPAYLDGITFLIVKDYNVTVTKLRTGELNFVEIAPVNVPAVKNIAGMRIRSVPIVNYWEIRLNNARVPFNDIKVRQAMTHAVDRDAILRAVIQGYGKMASGPIPDVLFWAFNRNVRKYPYDPQKALALLKEAGWSDTDGDGVPDKVIDGKKVPFRATVSTSNGHPVMEQVGIMAHQYFKKLGLDIRLEILEYNTKIFQRVVPRNYDIDINWRVMPPDPDMLNYYACKGGANTVNYCNPTVDDLLVRGRQIANQEERRKIYFQFQEIVADEAAEIFVYYPFEIQVLSLALQGVPTMGYRDGLRYASEFWLQR